MTRVQLALRSLPVLPALLLGIWASLPAAEATRAVDPTAGAIRYEAPSGHGYFALSLRAGGSTAAAEAHDHVLLIDTSASQAGAHRVQQLAVLDGFLNSLGAEDRVAVYAVDVKVQPITAGFVNAGSKELVAATSKLKKRVPLGASDLLPALTTALKAVDGSRPAGIVYFGDGMSSGRLIDAAEMRTVISDLRSREVPVHSFAVGPRTDLNLLGVLATHTGGVMLVDELVNDKDQTPNDIGRKLSAAAVAPVYYPTKLVTKPQLPHLLPTLPPVRGDRDTVLVGEGSLNEAVTVTVDANANGKPVPTMTWTIQPGETSVANTFLGPVWQTAEKDQGLSVPLAGRELVNYARQTHEDLVMQLVAAGNRAVSSRNLKQAQELAWQIRQLDPENVQSQTILNAAQEIANRTVALAQDEQPAEEKPAADEQPAAAEEKPAVTEEKPATDPNAPPADPNAAPADPSVPVVVPADPVEGTVSEQEALAAERERRILRAQQRRQEVEQAIQMSDRLKAAQPDEVINELKQLRSSVDADRDIDANIRVGLSNRLQNKILEVQSSRIVLEQRQQEVQRNAAQRQAEQRTLDLLIEREEKLERRIEQVRALMARGFAGDESAFPEAESVARLAFELDPYSGITSAAVFTTEAAGQLDQAMRLRARRADRWLEALFQSELSHIPFPDEPPVVYPPAEVWQFLTQKRKKWESVDLVRNNPIEEKIRRTLYAATTVNFDQNPFEDAIRFIGEQHGINIVIDKKTLEDEGVDTSSPITLKLDGISLRSVLKLMLEPLALTYIIEDEVMKITTATQAGSKLSTRVYYVGDLVIPIVTVQAGGIGQGLGGAGGFGGSQGSFGGGQFGVGGGGAGGNGFGGGGGGLFSVADEPEAFTNDAVKSKKKLPGQN